ncbi:hypothetical protein SAMN04490357_6879 [Streptomyces misionensis]|uniref:Uncharacterized protein n=1 Tax=Streptomyces misionensis TaxID=67331 RepID=A0A1H5G0P6_9ACTN|nr:hypothetical protein [Streptomyces misionensis]SEE09121.1 hypothetical protein SAMN04490357_6879 [Streptomyces misionensis]
MPSSHSFAVRTTFAAAAAMSALLLTAGVQHAGPAAGSSLSVRADGADQPEASVPDEWNSRG